MATSLPGTQAEHQDLSSQYHTWTRLSSKTELSMAMYQMLQLLIWDSWVLDIPRLYRQMIAGWPFLISRLEELGRLGEQSRPIGYLVDTQILQRLQVNP